MFTKDLFLSFYRAQQNEAAAGQCYDALACALVDAGILTDWTLIGALATVRVECGRSFLPVAENRLFSTRYELRTDLGNGKIGDGVKYRGRGYIQLTGRANYEEYGIKLGLDLLAKPELALDTEVAAKILAQYFRDRAVVTACNTKNWVLARKLVNGGTNGLTAFLSVVEQYISKIKNTMETLKIVYVFKPVDKTYVIYQTYKDGVLNTTGSWESDADLATNDEILAFAKTHVDASIEVELVV